MKSNLLVLLSITTVCFAQNEPQVADVQASLMKCQAESAEYMDRINQLVVELKKMDADIESSILSTLEFTQKYTDSSATGDRILGNKKMILRGLIESIERYSELQNDVAREINLDQSYVKEDMIKIRDWADAKMILRVGQLTELSASFGGYDYYISGRSADYDDGGYYNVERLAKDVAESKKDIILRMKKGIADLSKRSIELEKELSNLKAKRPLEDINRDLSAVNEKIAVLESSIEDIYTAETEKPIGEEGSREVEKEMRQRVRKIKSSSASFFKNFDAVMQMLRKQKSLNITIEKYEFAIEQLKADS